MANGTSEKDHLFVHAVTWNLGNTLPPTDSWFSNHNISSSIIFPPWKPGGEMKEDLVIISFQEIDRHSALFDGGEESWTKLLTRQLTSDSQFVRLAAVRMEKILLLVFIRRPLLNRVRNLRTTYTKTGMGGLRGNKGGVTVRLTLFGREICIVGCHLAAHLSEEAERFVDFNSILDEQLFYIPVDGGDSDELRIFDHDYVIVAGDLNFRLDDVPRQEVIDQLALVPDEEDNNDDDDDDEDDGKAAHRRAVFDSLLAHDQLLKAFGKEECFRGFEESRIDFKPTYKFDYGQWMRWDSIKGRKPAWTDRVIWRVRPREKRAEEKEREDEAGRDSLEKTKRKPLSIEGGAYLSDHAFINSDHKPVISHSKLRVDPFVDHYYFTNEVFVEVDFNWKIDEKTDCSLRFPPGFQIGRRDWVGLFEAMRIPHLKAFVTWYWVSSAVDVHVGKEDEESFKALTFERKYLKALDESGEESKGAHQLIYVSGDYDNVYGVSKVFSISHSRDDGGWTIF